MTACSITIGSFVGIERGMRRRSASAAIAPQIRVPDSQHACLVTYIHIVSRYCTISLGHWARVIYIYTVVSCLGPSVILHTAHTEASPTSSLVHPGHHCAGAGTSRTTKAVVLFTAMCRGRTNKLNARREKD